WALFSVAIAAPPRGQEVSGIAAPAATSSVTACGGGRRVRRGKREASGKGTRNKPVIGTTGLAGGRGSSGSACEVVVASTRAGLWGSGRLPAPNRRLGRL